MNHRSSFHLFLVAAVIFAAASLSARDAVAQTPSAAEVVRRACAAAGGMDVFLRAGALGVEVQREEATEDGSVHRSDARRFVNLPGPVPARLELPAQQVIAGDDGESGWALIAGRPDQRPQTNMMVRRMIQTDLFPALLPFSLTWQGVTVREVAAAESAGREVWRLLLEFDSGFFSSPQIARFWTLDLDRRTFDLVAAESPFTDLGQGIEANGMRFSWDGFTDVRGLTLPTKVQVVGLDREGSPKRHTRVDTIRWFPIPIGDAARLFENPIPPEQRPRIPAPGAAPPRR